MSAIRSSWSSMPQEKRTRSGVMPAAAKLAQGVERIVDVNWFEMGMPEAVWHLEAKEFGPLVVGMDTKGRSIYAGLRKAALEKIDALYPA